jgi:23S rRNA pseudouridine1911/1915/1917 synthase
MRTVNDSAPCRVDVLLASKLPGMTRSAAQKLCERGLVCKNGIPVKKNYLAASGEAFDVTLPPPRETALRPEAIALDVCYEDDDVIVVNKPRGLVVHPAAGHWDGTLVNALLHHCGENAFPVSTASCAPGSYTGSTRIPPAC